MKPTQLQVGLVVQLDPEKCKNLMLAACTMTATNDATNPPQAANAVSVGSTDWLDVIVRAAYEPGDGTTSGEMMWREQWWRPRWGCDTLDSLMDAVKYHEQTK